jgi:hypothetical protein
MNAVKIKPANISKKLVNVYSVRADRHGIFYLGEESYQLKRWYPSEILRVWTQPDGKIIMITNEDKQRTHYKRISEDQWSL